MGSGFPWKSFRTIVNKVGCDADFNPVRKALLSAELLALFVGVPIAKTVGWLPVPVIALLLVASGGCWLTLRLQQRIRPSDLKRFAVPRSEWRRILKTFALAAPLMVCLLWLLKPEALFSLVSRNPKLWLLVMLAYPLVSVLPQELVYRVFFFDRYRLLFGDGEGMTFASAAAFSFGHIVFHNWPAVVLTFPGGWLFARTYRRTSSLLFVAIEHAMYGAMVFTSGWGEFFLDGTLHLFRR